MRFFLYVPPSLSLILLLLLVRALIPTWIRLFPVFFANALLLFITTGVDSVLFFLDPEFRTLTARRIFYVDDMLRQAAVYVLVISFIYRAAVEHPKWKGMTRWLIAVAVGLTVILAFVHRSPNLARSMTNLTRDLSFAAMLMNLTLWVILVKERFSDLQLMMVTSGLGLQMTGESIGQSLRLTGANWVTLGNVILVGAHLACLLIWWMAFRRPNRPPSATESATSPAPSSR